MLGPSPLCEVLDFLKHKVLVDELLRTRSVRAEFIKWPRMDLDCTTIGLRFASRETVTHISL